jgi:hypothetical protein
MRHLSAAIHGCDPPASFKTTQTPLVASWELEISGLSVAGSARFLHRFVRRVFVGTRSNPALVESFHLKMNPLAYSIQRFPILNNNGHVHFFSGGFSDYCSRACANPSTKTLFGVNLCTQCISLQVELRTRRFFKLFFQKKNCLGPLSLTSYMWFPFPLFFFSFFFFFSR